MLELDQTEQEHELGEAVRPSIIHRLAKVVTTIAKGGEKVKTKLVKHNRSEKLESVVVKKVNSEI